MANNLRWAAEFYVRLSAQTDPDTAFSHARQQFGIYDRAALQQAIDALHAERSEE